MVKFVKSFVMDESGASAAEYALILAIVGTGIVVAAAALGTQISAAIQEAADCIQGGAGNGTCPAIPPAE